MDGTYHELGHATGSAKRLNRQFGKRFGDDAYAFEEIVASLCQATLCAEYGLPNELHKERERVRERNTKSTQKNTQTQKHRN